MCARSTLPFSLSVMTRASFAPPAASTGWRRWMVRSRKMAVFVAVLVSSS